MRRDGGTRVISEANHRARAGDDVLGLILGSLLA